MAIGNDTHATHGRLPHLSRPGKTYYVTFCTDRRRILPPSARDIVFDCCLQEHGRLHCLDSLVVMPDHVHLITTPFDTITIKRLIAAMKSASAHRINREFNGAGSVWQRESLDRIVRSSENLRIKSEYIANNPVRKALVKAPNDYPWLWRRWRLETAAEDGRRST